MPTKKTIETLPYTSAQVAAGFGTTLMTIYTWRQGTPTREKLPCSLIGGGARPRVLFNPSDVAAWAQRHQLKFSVERATRGAKSRPGPKPRLKPKKST